jgi:hypothetical protein
MGSASQPSYNAFWSWKHTGQTNQMHASQTLSLNSTGLPSNDQYGNLFSNNLFNSGFLIVNPDSYSDPYVYQIAGRSQLYYEFLSSPSPNPGFSVQMPGTYAAHFPPINNIQSWGDSYILFNNTTNPIPVNGYDGSTMMTLPSLTTVKFIVTAITSTEASNWSWFPLYGQNSYGSSGQVLTSAGGNSIPQWMSATASLGYYTQAGSATPLALTASSAGIIVITGSTNQIITLPSNSPQGQQFQIKNEMAANTITVESSGGGTIGVLKLLTGLTLTCMVANTTVTSGWSYL